MDTDDCLPFFHPSTVAYVDDDGELLQLLPPSVGALPYRTFTEPRGLLGAIENGALATGVDLHCWNHYTGRIGDPDTEAVLGLDTWMIFMRLFNRRRFALLSVVVVDYRMPDMCGLTLCRRLADLPCKKLLLTGQSDLPAAVQALNDGVIDMYMEKSQPDLAARLARAVTRLQRRFFADVSRTVIDFLRLQDRSFWGDETLFRLFNQHCRDRRVVEHYAVTDPRGFLMLDGCGSTGLWLVFDDNEVEARCQSARQLSAPTDVVAQMEMRQGILFIGDDVGHTVLSPDTWRRACVPLMRLPGRNRLYYAIVDDCAPFNLQPDNMLTFSAYLESGDAGGAPRGGS
jgi:CheY-like chemotaxis protein